MSYKFANTFHCYKPKQKQSIKEINISFIDLFLVPAEPVQLNWLEERIESWNGAFLLLFVTWMFMFVSENNFFFVYYIVSGLG
jgi:hypothetical protein